MNNALNVIHCNVLDDLKYSVGYLYSVFLSFEMTVNGEWGCLIHFHLLKRAG